MLVHGPLVEHDVFEQTQVCIVGSGAGGAVLARELAERGVDVVVLEQGAYVPPGAASGEAAQGLATPGGAAPATAATLVLGRPSLPLSLGRCLGGTAVAHAAACVRPPDALLRRQSLRLGLGSLDPDALRPCFERVESLLHVEPAAPEHAAGASGSTTPAAIHAGYLLPASRAGARFYAGCRAERILTLAGSATGVEGCFLEPGSGRARHRLGVSCSVLVICAGAIHTPVLLARNRLGRDLPRLGRDLALHPATRVVGLFEAPGPADPWNGGPLPLGGADFLGEGIALERVAAGSGEPAAAGAGPRDRTGPHRRSVTLGLSVEGSSRGRVLATPAGRPLPLYQVDRDDTRKLVRGLALAAEILFAAGASRVRLPLAGHEALRQPSEIDRLVRSHIVPAQLDLVALHPAGTCALGTDPRHSVLRENGELWSLDALFVADASLWPGGTGVPPLLSILALSTRIAGHVLARVAP